MATINAIRTRYRMRDKTYKEAVEFYAEHVLPDCPYLLEYLMREQNAKQKGLQSLSGKFLGR